MIFSLTPTYNQAQYKNDFVNIAFYNLEFLFLGKKKIQKNY